MSHLCLLPRPVSLRRLLALFGVLAFTALAQAQSWTNLPLSFGAGYGHFTSVAFGNGMFVAVGTVPFADRNIATTTLRLATSSDGTTWTARSITTTIDSPIGGQIRFLNGRFTLFAAGVRNSAFAATVYTSTDGLTWTGTDQSAGATSNPTETAFGGGRYVGVGGSGYMIGSTNGTTWSSLTSPLTGIYSFLDVAYGNGRWFATTNGAGGVITSTDGITWTTVPYFAALGGYRVEWCDGFWFFYSQANNVVSTDGVNFTRVGGAGGTATIKFLNGRLVSTGPGMFLTSTDGGTWSSMGNYPAGQSGSFMTEASYGAGKYVYVGGAFQVSPLIFNINEGNIPAPAVRPAITTAPVATNAVLGGSATFSIVATGVSNTYQWRKDNVAIPGATAATYTIASVTAGSAGSYTVVVTNSLGTITSSPAILTLVPVSQIGRLTNLAVRTTLAANQVLTVGFTMSGGGAKDVLVRAAGPGLGALGVPGTMADPKLALFNGSTQVAANDNWSGQTAVASAISAVGAFPFASTTSLDAALVASVDGGRTVQVSGPAAGNLIVEAYDAGTGASPRFTNLSALNRVGTGADVLIAGFTISGSTNKNVLIRAVGPSLAAAPFNLGGTLADPKLELYNSAQAKIGENDTWASSLSTTFSSVGAFGLVAGSKDAAVIVNLPPGGYTVQVSGADGGTGLAIIELYELP